MSMFEKLRTKCFDKLGNTSVRNWPPGELVESVQRWMNKVRHFGNSFGEELGTDSFPITDELEEVWSTQAVPALFYDHNLFALVGYYAPLHSIKSIIPFWGQPSRTVNILKDDLSRVMAVESQQSRWWPPLD